MSTLHKKIIAIEDSRRFVKRRGIERLDVYTAYAYIQGELPDQSLSVITVGVMKKTDRNTIDEFIRTIAREHPDYQMLLCRHFKRRVRHEDLECTLEDIQPVFVTRYELEAQNNPELTHQHKQAYEEADMRARNANIAIARYVREIPNIFAMTGEYASGHLIYIPRDISKDDSVVG